MNLKRAALALGLAGAGLLSLVTASLAAPAYATANVNVRTGPGTGYGVVDTLRPGELVDVQYCQGSWCFIQQQGPRGWVSANYLSRDGYAEPDYYVPFYDPLPVPPQIYIPPPPQVYIPPPPNVPYWNQRRGYPRWDDRDRWDEGWDRNSVCYNGLFGSVCVTD